MIDQARPPPPLFPLHLPPLPLYQFAVVANIVKVIIFLSINGELFEPNDTILSLTLKLVLLLVKD